MDIVKFYVPVFKRVFDGDEKVLVITVQNWNSCEVWEGYDKIFVFVHERGMTEDIRKEKRQALKNFVEANKQSEVWFIVWCPQHEKELKDDGLNSFYLPMGIDVDVFRPYRKTPRKYQRRIIYFGNAIHGKKQPFINLKNVVAKKGWRLDCISLNRFNNSKVKLSIERCRKILSTYRYGVAVGRSAQELSAMGLKVFCYGYGDVMFPDSLEKAKKLMLQNNTSWGEGLTLAEFSGLVNSRDLGRLKPIYKDCREIAERLEKVLLQVKSGML